MSASPQTYVFPSLDDVVKDGGDSSPETEDQLKARTAVEEAMRQAYQDGLERGRRAGRRELEAEAQAARIHASAAGREEGLAEAAGAARALSDLMRQLEADRSRIAREVEDFSVELALAALGNLLEVDSIRAEMVKRLVQIGVRALAPHPPSSIHMNPSDRRLLGGRIAGLPIGEDESLSPGHARIEAGRLFVEAGISQALEQIRFAMRKVCAAHHRSATQG